MAAGAPFVLRHSVFVIPWWVISGSFDIRDSAPPGRSARVLDAPEAGVVGAAVGRVLVPGRREVAAAVAVVAQERPAAADLLAGQPAAGGELPLGLGRQPLPGPLRVLGRVLPRDLHHRVILLPLQVGPLPLRPPPARPGHVPPPRRVRGAPVPPVEGG